MAGRRQIRAFEIALGPLEQAVVKDPIAPFEVEEHHQGAAHALVCEDRAARVEDECRHAYREADVEFSFDDAAVVDRRDVVAASPTAWVVFEPQIDVAGLEGFEHDRGVAEIVEADIVEIEAAAIDGKVFAPIVGIAAKTDRSSRIDV